MCTSQISKQIDFIHALRLRSGERSKRLTTNGINNLLFVVSLSKNSAKIS